VIDRHTLTPSRLAALKKLAELLESFGSSACTPTNKIDSFSLKRISLAHALICRDPCAVPLTLWAKEISKHGLSSSRLNESFSPQSV
jgi:hypothetical protein